MEHLDLLYSGLLLTAFMLSLWAAVLLTVTCMVFAPAFFAQVPSPSILKAARGLATRPGSLKAQRP